jgi:hypothetical protein
MESVKSGNLPLGILAGTGAALVGALIWMGITVLSGLHIGYVAIGIGALVGIAVRYAGQGSTPIFGVVGAVLTLIGCVLGEILAVIQLAANGAQIGFFTALSHVDPFKFLPAIFENSSPITYFIYAIGIFEGYKLARKK